MRSFYMTLPFTMALIEDEDGKILVGKQPFEDDKPFPGRWEMPAGKLKDNESIEECVIREVKEETGFDVTGLEIYKVFHNYGDNLPKRGPIPSVSVCYKVKVDGELKPDEMDDMHFADKDELKTLELTPWAEYFLEEYLL